MYVEVARVELDRWKEELDKRGVKYQVFDISHMNLKDREYHIKIEKRDVELAKELLVLRDEIDAEFGIVRK